MFGNFRPQQRCQIAAYRDHIFHRIEAAQDERADACRVVIHQRVGQLLWRSHKAAGIALAAA